MAGKLPKKQKHNLGRSHFKTPDEWYQASRKARDVNGVTHFIYDAARVDNAGVWSTYDNRLAKRAATNPRSNRARDLECVFGSPTSKAKKKPSKKRAGYVFDELRYAA